MATLSTGEGLAVRLKKIIMNMMYTTATNKKTFSTFKSLTLNGLAKKLPVLLFLMLSLLIGGKSWGQTDNFNNAGSMQTSSNWSTASKPTNANDIGLTSSTTTLTNTAGTITGRSINVTNSLSYTIGNATGVATNSTLILGVSGGFTNGISGNANDIFYLFNATTAPNLTISGPNTGSGTGTLGITLTSSGNFNIGSGSTLTISSVIAGAFNITKTGTGTFTLSGGNTYSGSTTISAGTLALASTGSIVSTSSIIIGSGATFDVSARTSTSLSSIPLSSLSSGANTTGIVKLATLGTITLSTGGITFPNIGATCSTAPLSLSGTGGTLALSNSPVTVSSSLPVGTYTLIAKGTNTSVTGTPGALTFTGAAGTTGSLSVVSGQLILTVASTSSAPTLTTTAAASITTSGATLAGNTSSAGTATVTSNGIAYALYSANTNPTVGGTNCTSTTPTAVQTGAFSSAITGLSVNTQYAYNAYATNSVGTSYGSASSFYTLANTPTAPTVGTPTGNSLNVTIGAIDGNPGATTYAIYCSTTSQYVQANGSLSASAVYQTASTWGASNTITVTGLSSGTSYTFYTIAKNGAGTATSNSPTASASTSSPTAPLAPTITSITPGNTTLSVAFTAPSSNGGSAITNYKYSTNGGSSFTACSPTQTTSPISITGLTNGTSYNVQIRAVNAIGDGTATGSTAATPATTPGAPTIGTASVSGTSGTASVTFTAPGSNGGASITSYTVTSSPGSFTGTGGTSPISVTGLTNGTAYTFTVTATNSIGTGSASGASNSVTPYTVPGAPTIGTATAGNASASVTFTAPGSNGGSAITSYTVTSSPGSFTGTGSTSPISVTGLSNGTAYTFTVTATNAAGAGTASAASNSVTPCGVISLPYSGESFENAGSLTACWSTAQVTGTSSALTYVTTSTSPTLSTAANGSYFVAYNAAAATSGDQMRLISPVFNTSTASAVAVTFSWYTSTGSSSSTDGITVTYTTNGTTYTVVGSNILRYAASNTWTTQTVVLPAGAISSTLQLGFLFTSSTGSSNCYFDNVNLITSPAAPSITSITPGNGQLTVNFTAGATGGSAITNYKYSTNGGSTWTSAGVTTSPITITGLTNGTSYNVQIKAVNAVGDGAATGSTAATPYTTPAAPSITSITPASGQLSVNFTAGSANGSAITNYKYSTDGGSSFTACSPTQTTSPIVITGLTNGTPYNVQIKAVNTAGDGTATGSTAATPYTTPGAPTITGITPANGQLSVAFTAGTTGGNAISNYKYSTDGGSTFTACSPTQTTSPIVITGLTNGTSYNVQIKAVNTAGDGTATGSTAATPYTTASASSITGITPGNGQLSVAFTAGASNGSAITNYKYSTNGGSTFTACSPTQTTSPIVITGLTNGTSYNVQIKAVNAAGDGTATASTASTPYTTPSAPSITGITAGDQQLSVAFTAGATGGSAITDYKYSTNGGSTFTSAGTTTSPIVITGLTNGTAYNVQLKAVNAAGDGTATSSVSGTPVAPATPVINTSGTLSAVNTTYGTASASPTSFSVSGGSLTGDLTVAAPSGFEVSVASGSGYSTSINLTATSGTVSSTTIYVRLASTTVAGTYSGNVHISGGGATAADVATASSTVGTYNLTISGLSGVNKTYDGTTSATLTGTATLSSTVNSDAITLNGSSVSSSFATAAVGNTKTITTTGYTLTGTHSSSYTVTQPTATANITAIALTLNGAIASDKTYDATNAATISGILTGVLAGETSNVSYLGTGTFAQSGIGTGIAVTSTASLTGSAASNYTLTQPTGLTATISAKTLTLTSAAASNKTYDGTNAATITGTLNGIVAADNGNVTLNGTGAFASVNVANGIAVTSTSSLTGSASGNYSLTQPTGLAANITAKALTITSAAATSKTYDGTNAAVITGTLSGVITADIGNVTLSGTGIFAQTAAGNGIAVTSTCTLGGAALGNYILTQPTGLTANITKVTLTVSGISTITKTYDGTNSATYTGTLIGVLAGDVSNVTLNGTGTYSQAGVGSGLTVTSTATLSGSAAVNYSLTQPTGLTGSITQASQTITFGALSGATTATADYSPGATSPTSGINAITYTSSNTAVATIVSGNIHIVGAGTTIITAAEAGSTNYSAATSVQQSLTVTVAYCTITGSTTSSYYISSVVASGTVVNAINNTTTFTAGGYANYTAQSVTQYPGSNITYSVSMYSVSSGYGVGVWVDWDNNGTFGNNSNEIIYTTTTGSQISANLSNKTLTVPVGQPAGSYRMRIIADYNASYRTNVNPNPCAILYTGSAYQGEVEDYTINVIVPTITGTATATAFTTTYGTASDAQSFPVSGSNLTANITATAPTGFEVSSDGITYGPTATFTQTSGTASGSLRIRLKATAGVSGSYNSQNITLTSTGATTVNITTASTGNTVSAASLTITANDVTKTYGSLLTGGTGSTAFTTSTLQNSETVGTVTIAYGTGAAANA